MAVSIIVAAVGAVATYAAADRQAGAQENAAREARISSQFQADANLQAQRDAADKDRLAQQAKDAQEKTSQELSKTPDVATDTNEAARRRVVQAAFNIDGAASSSTGSIRV